MLKRFGLIGMLVAFSATMFTFMHNGTASALSGSSFNAANIISDAVFYDGDALSASNVQTFLNSKLTTCDTSGTTSKSYYYDSNTGKINSSFVDSNKDGKNDSTNMWVTTSRATYGQRYATWYNAHPYSGYITNESVAPYICLKDYKQNTPTKNAESGICGYMPSRSGRTAAAIITDVAAACGVSPKVLTVILQKEQGLVTDDWPWKNQYDKAMGFACPDTSGCNTTYYGFFNQVYSAARQFKRYRADPTNWNYVAGQNNKIYWQTNLGNFLNPTGNATDPSRSGQSGCGYSWVSIQNQATAGLYNYTPYRPNQAALSNLYGTGDGCSAYGNRNFWRYFNDWFGSTTAVPYDYGALIQKVQVFSDAARTNELGATPTLTTGQTLYYTVTALNTGDKSWDQSFTKLGTSNPHDRTSAFCDTYWPSCGRATTLTESSVAPGQTGTFKFAMKAPSSDGSYSESFQLLAEHITWFHGDANITLNLSVSNPYNAKITSISTYGDNGYTHLIDPGAMTYGQTIYVRLKAKNTGNQSWSNSFVHVGTLNPKDRSSVFQDSSWLSSTRPAALIEATVAPGQTGTFQFSMTAPNVTNNYNESFGLLAESRAWMPEPIFTLSPKVIEPPLDRVFPNLKLYSYQSISSKNGLYQLAMQSDGNLVIYGNGRAIWSTSTRGSNALLAMQRDGNLVIYAGGKAVWSSHTAGKGTSTLVLQDDGNLVIYDSAGHATWSSRTNHNAVNTPTSLKSGETLSANGLLVSQNSVYRLAMQSDGNLVIYGDSRALWSSRTHGSNPTLAMQRDGNLVIYMEGHPAWSSRTAGKGPSTLVMQSDGNLVIYDANGHATWSSGTRQ